HLLCSLARRRLIWQMQRPEERDQRRRLCRTEVLPVRRHVAAALNHLSNELILREAHGHGVETRTALAAGAEGGTAAAAGVAQRVAVAALLGLKHERALSLQCRRAAEQVLRHGV